MIPCRVTRDRVRSTLSLSRLAKEKKVKRLARANRGSHGPRVRAKEIVKKTSGNPKEPEVPKAKHRKLVYEVLKTRNQRQVRKLRNLHRRVPLTILGFTMAGVLMNGMMTGVRLDGTKGTNV